MTYMSASASSFAGSHAHEGRPGRGRARYDDLALLLEGRIVGGIVSPGERLPSEAALCAEFNLSRVTVRKSLAILAASGLVHTRHGRGTYVADPLPRRVSAARSLGPTYMAFIDDLKVEGLLAPMRVLDRKEQRAGPAIADRLGVSPDDPVVRFRWVRASNTATVAYGIDHITLEVGRRITLADARASPSLVDAFERAGTWPTENIQSLTPVLASPDVARRLRVDVGSPVAQIDGVGLDRAGDPFETYQLWLSPGYRLQLRFIRVADAHPTP